MSDLGYAIGFGFGLLIPIAGYIALAIYIISTGGKLK